MVIGSTKRAKKQKKNIQGLILFGLIFVAIGIFIWIIKGASDDRITLGEDLCPVDGPIDSSVGYTAILIDGTDSFSPIQHANLSRYLLALQEQVAKHEQVSIFAPRVIVAEELLEPKLRLCNPGDGSDISGLTGNPRMAAVRYEREFRERISSTLDAVLNVTPADQSPIMSMVQAVTIATFPVANDGKPKRLIIVSDMLENTANYSHYSDRVDFGAVKKQPWFQHLATPMAGVKVEILYVSRQGSEARQNRGHMLFWEQFFMHLGASVTRVDRIGG